MRDFQQVSSLITKSQFSQKELGRNAGQKGSKIEGMGGSREVTDIGSGRFFGGGRGVRG